MELIAVSIFCALLIGCIALNIPILYALLAGLVIFCAYGRLKGFTWGQLGRMMLSSMKPAKNILLVFVLIGMVTALWRAGGTIAFIISQVVPLIRPGSLLLMSFLLNCGVSMLTGTSIGTAATMGVICMTMAASMGVSPLITGGAVLSGAYFGDRNSPLSTSANLICELTGTSIYDNVKRMFVSALVPALLTCAIYAAWGLFSSPSAASMDLRQLFSREFRLHWLTLLPAAAILILSLLRVNVKISMSVSIALAVFLCLFVQGLPLPRLLRLLVLGYRAQDAEVGALLNGGGIQSMLTVMAIICISSAYAGIFQQTGILAPLKSRLAKLAETITPFGGILLTSIISIMITCNQTLGVMLTHQLWHELETDPPRLALHIENSAVVVAPLIPWAIASSLPIAAMDAPAGSPLAACFLYLLPVYILLRELYLKKRGLPCKAESVK